MIRTAIASAILGCCAGAATFPAPDDVHVVPAIDPGCSEDAVAVIAHDVDGQGDPDDVWLCVALDDFADDASAARLDVVLELHRAG